MLNLFKKKKNRILKNPLFFCEVTCRYCYDHQNCKEKLYIPCACKGSLMWSHKNCLKECIKYQYNNKLYCPICLTKYIVPV